MGDPSGKQSQGLVALNAEEVFPTLTFFLDVDQGLLCAVLLLLGEGGRNAWRGDRRD